MADTEPKYIESQPLQYRPRDIRALEGMVAAGKTFSMTVVTGQVGDFVERISDQLAQAEAARPTVISLDSPTLQVDVSAVVQKTMHSFGFPGEFKEQNPEYYIWVNADHILEQGFAP